MSFDVDPNTLKQLERRLGRQHVCQRLERERSHRTEAITKGKRFFYVDNWFSIHSLIRNSLKVSGLYWRSLKNAERLRVVHNTFPVADLPPAFDKFVILHISDMHVDLSQGAMARLRQLVQNLRYDVCVLTGDYRGKTFGPFDATLEELARVRAHLKDPIYGVLGNHDSLLMLPGMEGIGIRMLMNESVTIKRDDQSLYLAGIDDAHFFGTHDIDKAVSSIPAGAFSILLSHTPEVYPEAGEVGFNLFLCGHTHGGQICLPGSRALTLDADVPRRFGSGPWDYNGMIGYTSVGAGSSVVPVRLNCPPEITLHTLKRA